MTSLELPASPWKEEENGSPADMITPAVQRGSPPVSSGSSLFLIMDPKDVPTVPGLPQHVYDQAAQYSQPVSYVLPSDQASSASSTPETQTAEPGDKYEKGAKAVKIFEKGIDWWNHQNKILGMHFGQEGPDLLEKYAKPAGDILVGVENGLDAASEIKKGAAVVPTVAGAGIKTASTIGATALGAEGGSALGGAFFGPPGLVVGGIAGGILGGIAPDWVYGHMSNQQVGDAAGRVLDNAGRSYQKYVIDNPYYDPRLAAMP